MDKTTIGTCGKCYLDLHTGESLRHFGTFVAHQEDRCIELLRRELARAHAELAAEREQHKNYEARCIAECTLLRTRAEAAERRADEATRRLRDVMQIASMAVDAVGLNNGEMRVMRAARAFLDAAKKDGVGMRKQVKLVCPSCQESHERFLHKHSAPYGMSDCHDSGSERFECPSCHYWLTREEAKRLGLRYVLDIKP